MNRVSASKDGAMLINSFLKFAGTLAQGTDRNPNNFKRITVKSVRQIGGRSNLT